MKGDVIEVVYLAGDKSERIKIMAGKAGEKVEVNRDARKVDVIVLDRNGNPKRTATFRPESVIATIEHPAR